LSFNGKNNGRSNKFQNFMTENIKEFDKNFVINTDQTGCQYRADVQRTLPIRGEKTTEVYIGDFNKVTHSYTAQYTITASGKLLPKVFLCMQEAKGCFGPVVSERVRKLEQEYGNIFVTASKSRKMTKDLVSSYVQNIVKSYVQNNKFLIILDS